MGKTKPICPYCNEEIEYLKNIIILTKFQMRVFLCPHCHKILGFNKQ